MGGRSASEIASVYRGSGNIPVRGAADNKSRCRFVSGQFAKRVAPLRADHELVVNVMIRPRIPVRFTGVTCQSISTLKFAVVVRYLTSHRRPPVKCGNFTPG